MENRPLIAITMGDPSGIGPEIIVKGLIRLPGVGHLANMEQPAAFNAAVLQFLQARFPV